MRALVAVLLIGLSGCLSSPSVDCQEDQVWFLGPDHTLVAEAPGSGQLGGNGFVEAFLTNDMDVWLSEPVPGFVIDGPVTVELWVENVGTPAPLAVGDDPQEGYHLFNQFGTDQTFHPSYAVEFADVLPEAGSIDHYTEEFAPAPGGFHVATGDRLRLLLTSLVLDDQDGSGHRILFGGDTPSQVRFTARCAVLGLLEPGPEVPGVAWDPTVFLPGNQGLLTGAIPEGTLNAWHFTMNWDGPATNVVFALRQTQSPNPAKDDVDMTIYDSSGQAVWNGGSPYSDETVVLWRDNLAVLFPDNHITVQVNSYSGIGYTGTFEGHIVLEEPATFSTSTGSGPATFS